MRKSRRIPVMNVGISLITLIFICLCLITFGVLSLQNAVSDQHLSEKAAAHTTSYYEAVNQMEVCKKETHDQLEQLWTNLEKTDKNVDDRDLFEQYKDVVQKSNWNHGECRKTEEGNLYLFFEKPVTDRQNLVMELTLCNPEQDEYYQVTRWELESADDWEADRSLDVYQGEKGD